MPTANCEPFALSEILITRITSYFEGGFSSVYFFETDEKDENAFGACFLIHKGLTGLKTAVDALFRCAFRQEPEGWLVGLYSRI
mgnify:CR=1 FL=1